VLAEEIMDVVNVALEQESVYGKMDESSSFGAIDSGDNTPMLGRPASILTLAKL
jgi:hypothetical protein